jgi:5-methylcytosine-specific restriction enzyme A
MHEQSEKERKRLLDLKRPQSQDRGYDADWRRVRAQYLGRNPWCCHPNCGRDAVEVDHIVAVKDAPHLRLSPSNLRGYCKPHHSARTARDQGFGRKG